ncbi:MAG: MFS transporter [Proteobacteria bacterium]|nr:MFS transporter [Pseudomonadota bacterium]
MTPSRDDRIFYGWYIAGFGLFANFMAIGTSYYIMNAFMEPLCQARGWTRTDLNVALILGMLSGFISQLLYGTIVMRTGPRILMVIGSLAGGLSCILLGRTDALWQFYLLYILLHAGSMAYGGIVTNTAVNNWFIKKRGRAMGLAAIGISFSGAVLPLLAMELVIYTDIATAFLILGLIVLAVGPLAWLIVKDWPETYGLEPDGEPSGKGPAPEPPIPALGQGYHPGAIWTLPELVRTGAFWKVGIAFALMLTGVGGVMAQLKPRFADIGFSDMSAMLMLSLTAFSGAVAKYIWGMLCDRFEPKKVVAVIMLMTALGLGLALFKGSMAALLAFSLIFGFAMGGAMSVFPIITAALFGRASFAAVFRFLSLFLILQLTGFIIMGRSYDLLGSYDPAFGLFIVLDLAAAFMILTVKRPEPR